MMHLLPSEEKVALQDIKMSKKDNALQRIDSHEKLCRIMQKQTYDKIHKLEKQINRIESILLVSVGALIIGMAYVIFTLIQH